MNPGDRIVLRSIRPTYLNGVRGTVVRQQPGEPRTLVRLDNDPKARRYAGGEWCVSTFTCKPDEGGEGLFGFICDAINPAAQRAAETLAQELAPALEEAVSEFGFKYAPQFLGSTWYDLYKPAILWQFYWHLANELRLIAEGHETVMFNSTREGNDG
jgi:hypothetical protein